MDTFKDELCLGCGYPATLCKCEIEHQTKMEFDIQLEWDNEDYTNIIKKGLQ